MWNEVVANKLSNNWPIGYSSQLGTLAEQQYLAKQGQPSVIDTEFAPKQTKPIAEAQYVLWLGRFPIESVEQLTR